MIFRQETTLLIEKLTSWRPATMAYGDQFWACWRTLKCRAFLSDFGMGSATKYDVPNSLAPRGCTFSGGAGMPGTVSMPAAKANPPARMRKPCFTLLYSFAWFGLMKS